ncbi:MAG: ParB N-terminal domain-containing protein [Halanaerobiales bacterium]|nr:ParB N-terminal domain-containing protein [Halanaerobiales bacterium]
MIELDKLERCCGPEPEMKYVDSVENWEKHISWFQKLICDGWDMAPLIVENIEGKLIISDGNHRWEAMKRENFEKCWVIIWDSDSEDNLQKYEEYLTTVQKGNLSPL